MPIKPIIDAVNEAKQSLENLTVAQVKQEMVDNPDLLVVDIREIQERVDLGTIPGSVHAPRGMLEFWADPATPYTRDWFREDRRTILFCAGGGRSALAAEAMRQMGFQSVAHLEPGFGGWQQAGEPVEDVKRTSRWVRREDPQA
jgi:rhodanese-related sulfurtransferase